MDSGLVSKKVPGARKMPMRTCHGGGTRTAWRSGGSTMIKSVQRRWKNGTNYRLCGREEWIAMSRDFASRFAPPAPDFTFGSLASRPASSSAGSGIRGPGSNG